MTKYLILGKSIFDRNLKAANKLFTLFLIANFLMATIGVPIYVHICEKSGTSYYSSCEDCSHMDESETDCCGNPIHSSAEDCKISCCADEILISKADITLNTENLFEHTKSEVVVIVDYVNLTTSININYLKINYPNIPPPDFGKKLIIKNSELKIDFISC